MSTRFVDGDARIAEHDDLPRANLAGFAQFDLAVDCDFAGGDEPFRRAAAVGKAHEFEQIVQFDVIAREREIEIGHGDRDRRRKERLGLAS